MRIAIRSFILFLLTVAGIREAHAQLVPDFAFISLANTKITSGCAPLVVIFADSSTFNGAPVPYRSIANGNAYNSHTWNFGVTPTVTSTVFKPSYVYTTAGTYTATLRVSGDGVTYQTITHTIIVHPEAIVAFRADRTSGCAPLPVTLCDTAANNTAWTWGVGGEPIKTDSCVFYNLIPNANNNCFDVTLIATNQFGCTKALTKYNYICIDKKPKAGFYADDSILCEAPFTTQFHDTSIGANGLSYQWFFGDNGISSDKEPVHSYFGPGDFTVTLIVTDTVCNQKDTIIKPYFIKARRGAVDFVIDNDSICRGDTISFNSSYTGTIDSLYWSFGLPGANSTLDHPSYIYNTAGTFSVTLQGFNSMGCIYDTTYTNLITVVAPPTVNFTAASTSSCQAPFPVNFTGSSTTGNIIWWIWNFEYPDTAMATSGVFSGPNASYTYLASGDYTVRLTAMNDFGCTNSLVQTNYIHIDPTVVDFDVDTNQGCIPLPIQFTDVSVSPADPIISWSWNFGDGSAPVNTRNAAHTYTTSGTFNACLTIITQTGCTGTRCLPINTGTLPVAAFTANPLSICVNEAVHVTNNSSGATTYYWEFGDNTNSGMPNPLPDHVYEDPGTYTLSLSAINNGCVSQTSVFVTVNFPKADFDDSTACASPGTYIFTDKSVGADTWSWNFGPGLGTSNLRNPTFVFPSSGLFTVTLTVTNIATGCTAIKSKQMQVSVLNADFTASSWSGCAPFTANFNSTSTGVALTSFWDFGDYAHPVTNTSTRPSLSYTYLDPGVYTISLRVTDYYGCVQTKTRVDTIIAAGALVNFQANVTTGCVVNGVGPNVTFTDSSIPIGYSIFSRFWSFGDTQNATVLGSANNTVSHQYNTPGLYDVALTVTLDPPLSCQSRDTLQHYIDINEPVANFNTGMNLYCPGQPIQFFNTSTGDGLTYLWDFDGNPATANDTSTAFQPQRAYPDTGSYNVRLTVTDRYGCTDVLTINNAVNIGIPELRFLASDTFRYCPPQVVNFTNFANFDTVSLVSALWDFGDSSYSTLFHPSHIYNQAGHFTVALMVEFANGCKDTLIYPNYINIGGAIGNLTAVPDTGCSPLTVFFDAHTNGSATIVIHAPGTGDFEQGVDTFTYIYNTPGFYYPVVILIDTQIPACQYILPYKDTVIVDTVYTDFHFVSDTICEAEPIRFTDSSRTLSGRPVVRWEWDFGDSTDIDTTKNPVHYYMDGGPMTITLRSYSSFGCVSERTRDIYVRHRPAALYTVSDSIGCEVLTVTFTDSSEAGDGVIDYWHWDFGDSIAGDTSLLQNPPPYYYADTGLYNAVLIVRDEFGCTDTATKLIGVYPNPNGISGDTVRRICIGDTIQLLGDTSYASWDWTPGIWLSDSTIGNPLAFPLDTITYTLLTIDTHGCQTLDSVTIIVNPLPTLVVTPYPETFLCLGDSIQLNAQSNGRAFNWTPPAGLNNPNIPNPIAKPTRTTTYQVYTVDSNSCNRTDTVKILVNIFYPYFEGERVCLGDTTDFVDISTSSDLPIQRWHWDFGAPATDDTSLVRNTQYLYPDSGVYQVTLVLTDQNGCTDTLMKPVRVDHPASPLAAPDTTICFGESVQLTSSGGEKIYWRPTTDMSDPNSYNPVVSPTISTVYIAYLTNGVCPYDTAQAWVEVIPTPLLETVTEHTILRGSSIELTSTANRGDSIFWTPADSLSCISCPSPRANPEVTTLYTVTVIDTHGCTNTKVVTVFVNTQCSPDQIFVGNGFTPNNDGINDVAFARLYGLKALHYFRVFDRWGNMIFETTNESTGWDGNNKGGEQLNSGVYVYVVEAECFNGDKLVKTGNVTLIK